MEVYEYGVLIRCFTFNQSQYIEQALTSFISQQTTFPFLIALVDDFSTDGQVSLLHRFLEREFDLSSDTSYEYETDYANIVYASHRQNKYCHILVHFLKYNHYSIRKKKAPYLLKWVKMSKYQAICEGDDYWIDKNKLQLQYNYLDQHLDCAMCFTAFRTVSPDGTEKDVYRYRTDVDECSIKDCIRKGGSYTKLNSILYRASYASPKPTWYTHAHVGDLPLFLTLFLHGKVAYINKVTCCYRKNAKGSWTESKNLWKTSEVLYTLKERWLFWNDVNAETRYIYSFAVYRRQIHDFISNISQLVKSVL